MKVSWQVTGIRHDAFANAHRIPESVRKPEPEIGTYLHPEAFGKPAHLQAQHARLEALKAHASPRQADPHTVR